MTMTAIDIMIVKTIAISVNVSVLSSAKLVVIDFGLEAKVGIEFRFSFGTDEVLFVKIGFAIS